MYPHFIHGETEVPRWLIDGETQLVSDGGRTETQSCPAQSISPARPDPSPTHMLPESWGSAHSPLHPPWCWQRTDDQKCLLLQTGLFPFLSLGRDLSCIGWMVQRQADYLTWDLGCHQLIQRIAGSKRGILSAEVVSEGFPASLFSEPVANTFLVASAKLGFCSAVAVPDQRNSHCHCQKPS